MTTDRRFDDDPVRYVITHVADSGLRVLTLPGQGRYTFATREEAEERMRLLAPSLCEKVLGDRADTLQVVGVPCYPGHFDPKRMVW